MYIYIFIVDASIQFAYIICLYDILVQIRKTMSVIFFCTFVFIENFIYANETFALVLYWNGLKNCENLFVAVDEVINK